jgi:hypothetical protein
MVAPRRGGRPARVGRTVRRLDPRESAAIGQAARHLAGLTFNRPGAAPETAAAILDELRARNLMRAERALLCRAC